MLLAMIRRGLMQSSEAFVDGNVHIEQSAQWKHQIENEVHPIDVNLETMDILGLN